MDFLDYKQLDHDHVVQSYGRFDFMPVSGKGCLCYDEAGKEYLDLSSGIGVNSLGFCDGEWVEAVAKQASTLQHMSNLYYTKPYIELATLLTEKTGCKKVFFSNSGAESNEGMIKAARKYSFDKYGAGRYEIITLVNSFHGRTITTLRATGQEVFHKFFDPFTEGFVYATANDLTDTLSKVTDKTCAIMMEMVQGEGGVLPLDVSYVQAIAKLCAERDILLLVDEVQAGVGRTGKFLSYEHFGVKPDLVSLAKGIGAGLPLGAVLFYDKTENVFHPGDHATTFGGNPVATAGACVVVKRMDDAFLSDVMRKGELFKTKLEALDTVESVSGKGLMIGIALKYGIDARQVVAECLKEGLIVLTAKTKVRLLPPLIINDEQIEKAVSTLAKVLDQLKKEKANG